MRQFTTLLAITLAATPSLAAIKLAAVDGWAVNPKTVVVYDHDGTPQGQKDLSGSDVSGLRDWDTEVGLVQVTDKYWVLSQNLKLTFCNASVVRKTPIAANVSPSGKTGFGSGGKCPQ